MAKGIRICKVCGKEYEYCHSVKTWDGINRWQDIACCPEHGAQYFAEVLGNSGAKANVDYQVLNKSDVEKKPESQRSKKTARPQKQINDVIENSESEEKD